MRALVFLQAKTEIAKEVKDTLTKSMASFGFMIIETLVSCCLMPLFRLLERIVARMTAIGVGLHKHLCALNMESFCLPVWPHLFAVMSFTPARPCLRLLDILDALAM